MKPLSITDSMNKNAHMTTIAMANKNRIFLCIRNPLTPTMGHGNVSTSIDQCSGKRRDGVLVVNH